MKNLKCYLISALVLFIGLGSLIAQPYTSIPVLGPRRSTAPLTARERKHLGWTMTQTNTNTAGIATKQSTLTNSAGLRAALSDETGTGLAVFSTSPTFTTGLTVPSITQTLSQASNDYQGFITAEWTPTAAMASGGTNGIYSIINPVENFQNAYCLRGRVDMRDKTSDSVCFNQIHAVDALLNLSEKVYSVDDNISVFGGAIHSVGITAGDVDSTGTMNMFFGVYPSSLTENFTVETNAMKIITWSNTHVDYGFNFENSGTTQAGIYLNNHASNSPATMVNGILMKSAAGKMTYGVNMTDAGITTADIIFQNGETIDNIGADTLKVTAPVFEVVGAIKTSMLTAELTDGAPSAAELNTATSLTPTTAEAGYQFFIKDTNGSSLTYLVTSNGTAWTYIVLADAS